MQAKILNLYFEFEQIQKNLMVFQKNFQQFLLEHSDSKNESAHVDIIHPTSPPCNETVSVVKLNISNTIQPIKKSVTGILDTIMNSVDEEISESSCEDEDEDEDHEESSDEEDDVDDPDYVEEEDTNPIIPNKKVVAVAEPLVVVSESFDINPVMDHDKYIGIERTFNMVPTVYEKYHAQFPNTFFKKICDGLYAVYHYTEKKLNNIIETVAEEAVEYVAPIAKKPNVDTIDDNTIRISSFRDTKNASGSYLINITDATCTCPHNVHRKAICKHMDYLMNMEGGVPFSMVDRLYNNIKTKYNVTN
jgi:hypothetical protein